MAFFASPAKAMIKKRYEKRQATAGAKLTRSISTDSLTGGQPILGISKDPEEDISQAMQELRAEFEARQHVKSS